MRPAPKHGRFEFHMQAGSPSRRPMSVVSIGLQYPPPVCSVLPLMRILMVFLRSKSG